MRRRPECQVSSDYEGLPPAASLLGPPGRPQPLRPCLHPRLQQRRCALSLPVLPATSHHDSTSPSGLGHPPTSRCSPSGLLLHLCGCAGFCTWFCLSLRKFFEGRGHALLCQAQHMFSVEEVVPCPQRAFHFHREMRPKKNWRAYLQKMVWMGGGSGIRDSPGDVLPLVVKIPSSFVE